MTAMSNGDGCSASGVDLTGVDVRAMIDAALAGRSPHAVVHGERWW